jgi:hypothetical protein
VYARSDLTPLVDAADHELHAALDDARRACILEEQGSGDLSGGDMIIEECFTSDGSLTWRTINEPYASELSDYNLGDPDSCVFAQL